MVCNWEYNVLKSIQSIVYLHWITWHLAFHHGTTGVSVGTKPCECNINPNVANLHQRKSGFHAKLLTNWGILAIILAQMCCVFYIKISSKFVMNLHHELLQESLPFYMWRSILHGLIQYNVLNEIPTPSLLNHAPSHYMYLFIANWISDTYDVLIIIKIGGSTLKVVCHICMHSRHNMYLFIANWISDTYINKVMFWIW